MDILSDVNVTGSLNVSKEIKTPFWIKVGDTMILNEYALAFLCENSIDERAHYSINNIHFRNGSNEFNFCSSPNDIEFLASIKNENSNSLIRFGMIELYNYAHNLSSTINERAPIICGISVPSGCKKFSISIYQNNTFPLVVAYNSSTGKKVEMDYEYSCVDGKPTLLASLADSSGGDFIFKIV